MKKSKLLTLLVLVLAACTVFGMMVFPASAAADHPHTADTTHCACGGLGAKESHAECVNETWKPWTNGMASPTSGNYYLAEDVTITKAISLGGNLKICLNGYTLTCDGARLTTYTGTSLRNIDVCDCSQGKTGKITSNFTANQGGIFLHRCGTINLYSGTLEHTGTASTVNGGIIRLGYSKSTSTATFNMYGGTITGGVAAKGGNIYSGESTAITVNLYAGTITGGTATSHGGNICMDKGTLNLKGTILENGTCTDGVGGNLYTCVTTNMTAGRIYGGSASGYGDNVQVQGAGFTMPGGSIGEDNQTATEAGHNLTMINGTLNVTGGNITGLVRVTCTGDNTSTVNINQGGRIYGGAENLRLVHNNVTLNVGTAKADLGDSGLLGITLDSAYTNATFANATKDPAGKVFSDDKYANIVYADGKLSLVANTMQVGFGKVSIAPAAGTPLGGYGDSATRLSSGNDETYGLTATAIAITDSKNETFLLITADLVSLPDSVVTEARNAIKEATGVSVSHIVISATHTHTAPNLSFEHEAIDAYKTALYANLVEAAKDAIADRTAATAQIGSVEISGQNYIRHYTDAEGNYYGYAHWADAAINSGKTLTHAAEADCTMQLLKFDRTDKTPVVIANWQTHPHLLGNVDYASADLVGAFRDALGTAQGWNVAYFSGASGNVNPKSPVVTEDKTYVSMGQAMAQVAATVEFTNAGLSTMETKQTKYAATYKTVTEEQYNAATSFLASADTDWEAAKAAGFNSIYEAKTLKAVYEAAQKSATRELELHAISLGQIAFVTAPYEMFDANGETIKAADSHAMTFVLTNANGSVGYIPSDLSGVTAPDGIYELDSTKFVTGTGEALAETYVKMLAKLVSDEYCVCGDKCSGRQGHTCTDVAWQAFPANGKMPTSGNYYLNNDVSLTYGAGLCSIEGSLALDLRGKTLTLNATGKGRAFTIGEGETLSICDSVGGGQIILTGSLTQSGGLIFNNKGTANIFGGTIDASAITAATAEGVIIRNAGSSFCNIYNATLIGGTTTGVGGAISNAGTLNVYTDVTVKNGSAKLGGNIYSTTAPIKIWGDVIGGTATEKGGNIYAAYTTYVYGKVDGGSAPLGGNIFQNQYTAMLFGAQIVNAKQGGGVYINTGAKVTVGSDTTTSMNKMDESTFVNLYLPTGTLIGLGTKNEPLLAAANVGITQEDPTQPIASTATTYFASGVSASDVFFKQGADCGVAEIEGQLYFQDYVAYAYYKQDDVFKSKGYYSMEDAIAHEGMLYVKLCADCNEELNIASDLYLDLAGYSVNATVNVADGATLYGMDSATDDYEGAYGKITAVTGSYAPVLSFTTAAGMRRYVAVAEETGISFHRYYAAVTAISLKPDSDALGYKATFRGDEKACAAVESFGFKMWVAGNAAKIYTKTGSFTDNQMVTLRLSNILANNGGEKSISAQAVVKFSHVADVAIGSTQATTMKAALQAVNEAWAGYSEEQKQAVLTLCGKFDITKTWELNNILPTT